MLLFLYHSHYLHFGDDPLCITATRLDRVNSAATLLLGRNLALVEANLIIHDLALTEAEAVVNLAVKEARG